MTPALGSHTHYPPDGGAIEHNGPPESCDATGWGDSVIREAPRPPRHADVGAHVIDSVSTSVAVCEDDVEHVHIVVRDTTYLVSVVNAYAGSRLSRHATFATGEVVVTVVPHRPNWWQRLLGFTLDAAVDRARHAAWTAYVERTGMYDARTHAERKYGVRRRR